MKRSVLLLRSVGLLALGAVSLQCGKDSLSLPIELGPAKIDVIDGDGQTGVVGDALPDSLVARVTNSNKAPVQGARVVFRFTASNVGADLIPDTALTDGDGRARSKWLLGHVAGAQVVQAEVKTDAGQTLSQSFHATALAGPATTITAIKGDQQTGQVGTALADSLVVKVTDQFGNPVSGVSVSWTAHGGGTVSAATVNTGTNGQAAVQRVLGSTAGPQSAEADAAGLNGSPIGFTHTAIASAGTKLGMATQPSASAQSGSVLAQQPAVQVQDGSGNPVAQPGVMVHVAVSTGGTLGGTDSVATDATGLARFSGLSITGAAGNYTLSFSAPSRTGVTSTPVALSAGTATKLTITTQPSNTAQSGVPLAQQPVIQLRDDALNPVHQSGVPVTAGILTGPGGVLSQATITVQTDANGVAAFSGLLLSGALGSYTLQFAGPSQPAVAANPIVLSAGPAKVLVLVTPPSTSPQSGVAFPQQPVVRLEDGTGNPVSQGGTTVTASIFSGGGTLGGTTGVSTSASGVATFTNLSLSGTIGPRVLDFTATGLTKTSANVTLAAGPAATLAIQAGDNQTATVGSPVPIDPAVLVSDAAGNPVAGVAVAFAVATGGGSVGGAQQATDVNGIATVGSWTLGTTASSNTLTATSAGLAGSPVTFHATGTPGSAGKLAIVTQPSSTAQSGRPFAQQPAIQLQDQNGNNLQTDGVAISANSSAGTLNGNTTVATVNGVATFTNLSITGTVGTYTLTFGGTNLTGITSNNITLSAGRATQLVVTTQPSAQVQSGIAFPQEPVVQIQDAAGNPADTTKTIFATLRSGGGALGGTISLSTGGGNSVTFTNLSVIGLVGPRTLLFSASGLASDTSSTFNVVAGNPAQIAAVSPVTQSAPVSMAVTSPPSVVVKDGAGNPVAGVTVTFAITAGGGSLNGPTQTTNASGVATVSDWTLGSVAGTNTVTATATGSGISGNPVTFTATGTAAGATQLSITTQPSTAAQSGAVFAVQPVIQLRDANGNAVSQANVSVTVTASGGTLGGTTSVLTSASGAATFSGLSISGLAGSYTLTFQATGLTPVTSGNIALTAGAAATIAKSAGDGQSAPAGTAVPIDPAVLVTDAAGNPVVGRSVTFTVGLGAGSITGGNATTNASGIATVGSWTLGAAAGPNTLTATSTGLNGSPLTFTATGTTGSATQLAITTQPSTTAQSGLAIPTQPVVQLQDGSGNDVAQANVDVTATVSAGGTLAGTQTVPTNASGVATFTNLAISGLVGNYTLSFAASAPGVSGATSNTIALTAGAAVKLGVNRQPSATAQSGVAIVVQPRIQILDAAGNSVSQSGTTITASFASGSGTLTNATATTNSAGLATFAGLTISGTVGSYTLRYDATGLTGVTSNPITLNPGPADQVTITVQPPPSASSGVALSPQPVVQLRDGAGNAVSQSGTSITASIASGTGGSLTNTVATTDAGGAATFSGLTLSGPTGNFTLSFGAAGLTAAVSNTIALGAGAASVLSIQTQPSTTAQNGVVFATQPAVRLRDANNNPVNQPGVVISVAILSGGGTLNGTTTATTNGGGIASFTNLSITGLVGQRTLIFSASGFVSTTSSTITITPGSATQLALTTDPSSTVQSGVDFPTQPVVQLRDQSGNNVTQSSISVNATIASGGGTLSGTLPINTNANGQAVFTDLAISGVVGTRTLTFTSSGLSSVTSGLIDVTAGQATQLGLTTQPSANAASGVPFPQQPVIQLRDGAGNAVSQGGVDIDVAVLSGSATLSGTTTATTNGSGVASFSNLELTGPAGPHTLRFTSSGLTGVTSAVINLGAGSATKLTITTQPSATAQNSIAFPQQPAIQLRDASNNPVAQAGVTVTAAIASGGGSIGGTTTANTNASGLATFNNLEITGVVGNRTLIFTSGALASVTSGAIDLEAGSATTIAASAGDGQSADAGTPVAVPPEVLVTDVSGNPVSGVNVTFAVATGGGSVVPTSPVATDANGNAAVTSWTLGSTPGTNTLTATSGGLSGSPVTFTANGLTGAATKFTITTQPSSTARNAIAFAQQPVLQLRDAQNNVVSQNGVQVTASITSGGGALGGSTLTVNTDANGVATFPDLEITGTVGPRTLTFTSAGLTGATSNSINLVAGDPTSIVVQAGNNQNATVNQAVTVPPTVLIGDVSNNPVNNVSVTFAVESGGGNATGLTQSTDNSGQASVGSWTLGTTAGTNTLSATSSGLTGSPVTFTATGTPDVAAAAQSTANVPDGTIQIQTVISIQARDQFGNALTSGGSNVEVTVTGANSANATVTDNDDGTYTATYLPDQPGTDTITITLDGGPISGSPFTSNVAP